MNSDTIVVPLILGIIEGLTEFLPVSSTGHLLLAGHFLGFDNPGRTFEVLIQLGAILAILTVYSGRLVKLAACAAARPEARGASSLGVLLAFLPAAIVGVLAHDFIKTVLFETPVLICIDADRRRHRPALRRPAGAQAALHRRHGLSARPRLLHRALPVLAMIPGVSRSGATIVGALLLGTDKRSAAEFSFFLAMPTMAGAFAYDLYKNRDIIDASQIGLDRDRLRRGLHRGAARGALAARFRQPPRLCALRLVADRRRRGGARRAVPGGVNERPPQRSFEGPAAGQGNPAAPWRPHSRPIKGATAAGPARRSPNHEAE